MRVSALRTRNGPLHRLLNSLACFTVRFLRDPFVPSKRERANFVFHIALHRPGKAIPPRDRTQLLYCASLRD